jgi:hypothetical protein
VDEPDSRGRYLGRDQPGSDLAVDLGAVGVRRAALAQVTCTDGVTAEWLKAGGFTVRTDERDWPARLQITPFYDPQRLRILADD